MLRVGFGGCLSDLSDPWSKRSVDASSLDKRVWSRVGPRQWLYIAGRKQATGHELITERNDPDPVRERLAPVAPTWRFATVKAP